MFPQNLILHCPDHILGLEPSWLLAGPGDGGTHCCFKKQPVMSFSLPFKPVEKMIVIARSSISCLQVGKKEWISRDAHVPGLCCPAIWHFCLAEQSGGSSWTQTTVPQIWSPLPGMGPWTRVLTPYIPQLPLSKRWYDSNILIGFWGLSKINTCWVVVGNIFISMKIASFLYRLRILLELIFFWNLKK